MHYINESGYTATPNQREEIKAYRDENTRNLVRITASGTKTKIEFKLRKGLHLDDKIAIQKWFTDAESNAKERKINLQYWNDEDNRYETGDFYRPDLVFTIRKVTDDDIIYDALEIHLVEY